VDHALRVNTINGAYASNEAIKRSIKPGKLADFVILLDTVDKDKDIAIVRTVAAGNTVYQS
jgi:predicted amidohydrolase YtcJ